MITIIDRTKNCNTRSHISIQQTRIQRISIYTINTLTPYLHHNPAHQQSQSSHTPFNISHTRFTSSQAATRTNMRFTTASIPLALAALASATSQNSTSAPLNAVPSSWDGSCYYPKADIGFQLESYLGKWFQVAGTVAPFTAGCKCIQAQYELNVRDRLDSLKSDQSAK